MPVCNEEWLDGAGGLRIFNRSWRPEGNIRGVVVLSHGFNSHSGYYIWTAQQLAGSGLAVYALDYRGRGKSDGERYYVETFADYQGDLDLTVKLARSREPGLPIFILGHSAGGVVACNYVLDNQRQIAGLICESFAYRVPAPDFALAVLRGLAHLAPHAHVLKLPKKDFSRDPKVVQALIDDPLLANEVQPTRTVAEMVRADERLKRDFPQFTLPLLIIHGTRDAVTRPEGSQEFYARAGSPDKTLKLYEGYFHDPLNDIGKEAVMADIRGWIEKRL
ncbi:MAG TPA: alpha/beta hydrolase [Steroidobacteraceae bacterium]|jgi:alpha-beta hydrolase superfamily lysophospholipase|nr:alpha/beta hydrolase [Steroidobacteraceae bacterium]